MPVNYSETARRLQDACEFPLKISGYFGDVLRIRHLCSTESVRFPSFEALRIVSNPEEEAADLEQVIHKYQTDLWRMWNE